IAVWRWATQRDGFELGGIAGVQCPEQRIIGGGIDFPEIIVGKSLAVVPNSLRVMILVIIIRMGWRFLLKFILRGTDSQAVSLDAALLCAVSNDFRCLNGHAFVSEQRGQRDRSRRRRCTADTHEEFTPVQR